MHRNLSKIIYLIVCFVFFLFSDLYLSNLLVREINSGLNINNGVFALNYIKIPVQHLVFCAIQESF